MGVQSAAERFTARHHALLFAWIARAVVERMGRTEGERVVREAVRRYGEERGHRMRLRAELNGDAPSMTNYLAYGEWSVPQGWSKSVVLQTVPDRKTHVLKCPWHEAWLELGVLEFGRLYCLEIDEALVRGFNASLRLDVNCTQSNGADWCEFVFHDLGDDDQIGAASGRRVMHWAYHTGHLFATIGAVLLDRLGEAGQLSLDEALAVFAEVYGQAAADVVVGYRDMDFTRLPED